MTSSRIRDYRELLNDPRLSPKSDSESEWGAQVVIHEDNLTYLAFNTRTREAIWVDPVLDDWATLIQLASDFSDYRWVCVIDTHTHADHLSCAGELARTLGAPLVMHRNAPSSKVDLRVSHDTLIPTAAGPLRLILTPGHTWDGLTPFWGPFMFTGDTIFYGDTGRDDLPTGNPEEHHQSLQKIKALAQPDQIVLPGHDAHGGRASTWATQLEINPALTQSKEEYLRDGGAWTGKTPKLLKESLYHNFK
jgi:sulfur dioxygenase